MDSKWRRVMPATLICVVSFAVALPAYAAHTPPHAAAEIDAIANEATQQMGDVVTGFEEAIAGLGSTGEVEDAADSAEAEIESIWQGARAAIDEVAKPYPGLGQEAGAAKQSIQQARQESRNTISDLVDAWVPQPATTTTTTTPTTTSTTTTTTTIGAGNGSGGNGGGNNGGGNGNGSGNGNSNGNGQGNRNPTGAPTDPVSSGEDPRPPGPDDTPSGPGRSEPDVSSPGDGGQETVNGSAGGGLQVLAAQTTTQPVPFTPQSLVHKPDGAEPSATEVMATALETVLPPAVVDLVLSPLIILEILIGTIVDGGGRVIGPLLLLGGCAILMFGYDRRSRRRAEPIVGVDGLEPPAPAI